MNVGNRPFDPFGDELETLLRDFCKKNRITVVRAYFYTEESSIPVLSWACKFEDLAHTDT